MAMFRASCAAQIKPSDVLANETSENPKFGPETI